MESPPTFFMVVAGGIVVTAIVMALVMGYYFGMLDLLEWLSKKVEAWRAGSSK